MCVYVNYSVMSDSLDTMDYSLPGSSVHAILQARILAWVAIPFTRRSPWPRDQSLIVWDEENYIFMQDHQEN